MNEIYDLISIFVMFSSKKYINILKTRSIEGIYSSIWLRHLLYVQLIYNWMVILTA